MATALPMSSISLVGGRSSVSGMKVCVFGGTGFLGKYVINRLGKIGTRLVVPHRDSDYDVGRLKLSTDLGMMRLPQTSIRKLEDIEAAVDGCNVVINLLGRHIESSRWSFQDVNSTFPSVLAQVCADKGVERFVHVSALGAYMDSPSAFSRSKAIGEELVREAFPKATILRPATMFGDEDKFLNRIAKLSQLLPIYPLVNAATTKLVDYVFKVIKEESNAVNLPQPVAYGIASAFGMLPNPWISLDGLRRQSVDLVMPEGASGFEDLGINKLTAVEDVAERYLVRFRKMSVFVEEGEVVNAPK